MPVLKLPPRVTKAIIEGQNKWLQLLLNAEKLVKEDADLQAKAAKGLRIKERSVPPEVIGRIYAQYCDLINRMYDAYLNNIQLQRAAYMQEIIGVMVKRMYELRNELVHLIVNDYIYVDSALIQLFKTPDDIQIVTPYHFPIESRPESIEELLRKMWADAVRRKNAPPKKVKPLKAPPPTSLFDDDDDEAPTQIIEEEMSEEEVEEIVPVESVHTTISEDFIQILLIQKHERFRIFFMVHFREKCRKRKTFFANKSKEAPKKLKIKAARLIQTVYRVLMKIRRQQIQDFKRDVLLGLAFDPERKKLDFNEENDKVYERRRRKRQELNKAYLEDIERQNIKLLLLRKDEQIEDITEDIREWFRAWFYGYGFFPEYPYELDGGTIVVIRGDYPTIEEKQEADEKYIAATKGKTKEQLKQEKEQARLDAEMKAELEKEKQDKDAEQLFKMRCNPYADPGYKPQESEVVRGIVEAFQKYRSAWTIYDNIPPEYAIDTVYGYMQSVVTEDLMAHMHQECRIYVDELMRLELKLLIKVHQQMYKRIGKKYPKMRVKPPPKAPAVPKPFILDNDVMTNIEKIFDLGIITKPTVKLRDISGDFNFYAYDANLADPDASFPPPGYGDVKRRLQLSCVFGSGIEPAAKRNRSVMILGPERNGKSFLVDAVAGEMNAIKIDISPEKFSAVVNKPGKLLMHVYNAARAFQPAVIYMRNVERVFYKKVPPNERKLKAKSLKKALDKLVSKIATDSQVIFIATCTNPFAAAAKPLVSLFDEIILIPTPDYGSIKQFFYDKFRSIRSMPYNYPVQPLGQMLQGYGFGLIIEVYNNVMTPERIIRLNCDPLLHSEFIHPLIDEDIEPVSAEDFAKYTAFFLRYSPLNAERIEFEEINRKRAIAYEKLADKMGENEED